jgi:hypothetical protein
VDLRAFPRTVRPLVLWDLPVPALLEAERAGAVVASWGCPAH